MNNWYTMSKPDARQGIIAEDSTGRSVAVSYDAKDAPLIAAAPELLAALEALLACPAMNEDSAEPATLEAYKLALAAIAKAKGA